MKEVLLEIIDFYRYKLVNDKCTPRDMQIAFDLLSESVVCEATIKDIAEFYGQSESNVRNIASRKSVQKSRHAIIYDFKSFINAIPERWKKQRV